MWEGGGGGGERGWSDKEGREMESYRHPLQCDLAQPSRHSPVLGIVGAGVLDSDNDKDVLKL